MSRRTDWLVDFQVTGRPAPQGSKIRTPYGIRESSKYLPAWREQVRIAATKAAAELSDPITGALVLSVTFYIERPGTVSPTKRPLPIVKPDLDKLVRTMDSLKTGGLIGDDAQLVTIHARKRYADGRPAGARIRLRRPNVTEI